MKTNINKHGQPYIDIKESMLCMGVRVYWRLLRLLVYKESELYKDSTFRNFRIVRDELVTRNRWLEQEEKYLPTLTAFRVLPGACFVYDGWHYDV